MSVRFDNEYGNITIVPKVFANLAGYAATSCYGVVGMVSRSKTDGIVRLLKKDSMDKGIEVTVEKDNISIDIHIMVEYGINIQAICESIMSRVKYFVETATGLTVNVVNVFVDSIRVNE